MAFKDKGGFWLSNSEEVLNPYFGSKMLHCGEIQEKIFNP
jgi:Cu(I)/Ag(I) efflux system membrane fusion protein